MRLLLIEDDERLCESLTYQLNQEGFAVDICCDGADGLRWCRQLAHDLILLDQMLPSMNGLTVLKKLRQEGISTPVIMITALGELHDKIAGLDLGADDYIVKPFEFDELMARIRCINRRPKQWEGEKRLTLADITYDPTDKILYGSKESCTLSKKEGDLLEIFLKNPKQTLPRMLLLSRVWGPDAGVEEGNLDNYIHFLRRRLKSVNSSLSIKTVRGIGYRLEAAHV